MVRRQFNEYVSMKRTMLYMTITLASYALFIFLVDDTVLERRLALLCESCDCSSHRAIFMKCILERQFVELECAVP